ncbi:MAG: riboflavin kinase [Lachnospiraceae bacterium]|nr:riboflavin kinase [Lachnospiraceae bacterium]
MKKLPFTLTGTVTHGKGLGHDFGVPTANIIPRESIEGLEFGVYYSRITVTDSPGIEIAGEVALFNAITNLGKRPSVNDGETVNAESFIYDYQGDLYGKEIRVTLLEFKRPEERFASLEALFDKIHKDIEDGKGYS